MATSECNLTTLSGRVLERGAVRHTPAGIPVLEFLIAHASVQVEAETERKVECEMTCKAVGQMANLMLAVHPGTRVKVTGFLAARSLKRRSPILHVNSVEFEEGKENGIQTEKQDRR